MIRINLLPQKKKARQDVGQKQLIYMGFSLLVVMGGVVFFHLHTEGELEAIQRENQAIQADIDRDFILRGQDAVDYGLVDEIIEHRKPRPVAAFHPGEVAAAGA